MQIVVLGPHRSGTSLVTRLINLMGAYFGDESDAIDTAEDNPKGFWERKDVVAVNDEVLALAGGAAIAPPLLEPGWEDSPTFDPLRERAAGLLAGWLDGEAMDAE